MKSKSRLITALGLLILSACSPPEAKEKENTDKASGPFHYSNARFEFTVTIPDNFIPQGESDNGDGQIFKSTDGTAEIRAWGGHLMEPEIKCSAIEQFKDELPTPTYKHSRGGTSIVSGHIGDDILYAKVIRTDDRCLGLTFTYPANEKDSYDAAVQSASQSFRG